MPVEIRMARAEDAAAIQHIYAPFCESAIVSFEVATPTVEEMAARIAKTVAKYPWLVLDRDSDRDGDRDVLGYAYASAHRERAAYQWSVDVSVYVADGQRRAGIGRALYTALFELLAAQGYVNAYAGIALPNDGSVGLHTAVGFTLVGTYHQVGYKFGAWHDVAWFERPLLPERNTPATPIPITQLVDTPVWQEATAHGLAWYRG